MSNLSKMLIDIDKEIININKKIEKEEFLETLKDWIKTKNIHLEEKNDIIELITLFKKINKLSEQT